MINAVVHALFHVFRLDSHALIVGHDGTGACLKSIQLTLRISRRGSIMAAPVVQHLGHMHDAILHGLRLLVSLFFDEQAAHNPENQIIIL